MIIFKNKKIIIPVGLGPNFQEGYEKIHNQNKTVDSSTVSQIVYPDAGYSGLGKVVVNPYELDSKEVDSSTVTQVITSDKDGLYSVVVNPCQLGFITIDSSTQSQLFTGAYDTIYVNPYNLDEKTIDSSTVSQVVTSDKDGLSKVTINPYVLSPLEVDSSTARQEITGQYGTVTVNPYTLDSSNAVITENGDYAFESSADGLSRVDVTVNIDTQSYYNEGYSNGKTAGIAEQKAKLDSSTFTSNGTYTREDGWNEIEVAVPTVNNQNKTVDASINSQTVTYDPGYTGLGTVTVNPYALQNKALELEPSYRNEDVRGAVVKVEPDEGYDGLSYFQYRLPSILTSKTFDASTGNQTYVTNTANTYVKGINKIVINGLDLDSCYNLAASI